MSKQEIVQAFTQAEIDFSNPMNSTNDIGSRDISLCSYFRNCQDLDYHQIHKILEPLWLKYRTINKYMGFYVFNNRKERLDAIRKVITDLEKE